MSDNKALKSIQDELRKELDTLKERVDPPSGFTISTKGKVFNLPDGSSDQGPMHCIILDWVTSNIYFEGIYNPNDIKPPACFAISDTPAGMMPSDNSPKRQDTYTDEDGVTHEKAGCAKCPQNQWGSGSSKGKACKNTRKLLIVPTNADKSTQPWVIVVSPTGLKHFDKYVNTLSDLGKHPIEIVTEISFDEQEPYPSLRFRAEEVHDNLVVAWALKESGQDILHQEPNVEKK